MNPRAAKRLSGLARSLSTAPTLARLRARAVLTPAGRPGTLVVGGVRVAYPDLLEAKVGVDHIFRRRIYHPRPGRPDPRVIDAGGHIGLCSLYLKTQWPAARITILEPDQGVVGYLRDNIAAAGHSDVEIVEAALSGTPGFVTFSATGGDDGRLDQTGDVRVAALTLSSLLEEELDFLKLNIEGAELEVLQEAGDRLRKVREMVIEYHDWAGEPQRLGPLLQTLSDQGFRYVVNHFDYLTNPAARPPFTLDTGTTWWALVHARRDDLL